MSILQSKYYDQPEGKDAGGKVIAMNRYAVSAALAYGTLDVLTISHPKGYVQTLFRYAYFVGPLSGMATSYALGTYALTNIRNKDDNWNSVFGSMLAGGVYGAWKRTFPGGVFMGMVFSLAAILKRMSVNEGWEFFPDVKRQTGSLRSATSDFTIMRDPPRGWTTTPETETETQENVNV